MAGRQACYDGALGARAMHRLQMYCHDETETYDNNAYTITSIYQAGMLMMYTSHPGAPQKPGAGTEYYMTQVNGWAMIGNPEAFRQGATALRNAIDWTGEKRQEFIEKANTTRRNRQAEVPLATDTRSTVFSSVETEASLSRAERHTAELPSQESQTTPYDYSNEISNPQDSEISGMAESSSSVKRRKRSNNAGHPG